jgi:exocyst complex component 5
MLDKFVNQVQSSTNPSLDSLKKLAGLDRRKHEKDEKIVEPEFTEQDGILRLDIAKRMLKWHAEAIGRAVELTQQTELYESNLCRTNSC